MKTLVVGNQKGGVGKTAVLVHLAHDYIERGLKVAVIDLDTQANASFTLSEFKTGLLASHLFDENKVMVDTINYKELALIEADAGLANLESSPPAIPSANFVDKINKLAEHGFDVCLIDTAPSLGVAMVAALLSADQVLSPIELEAYSIQGIQKMRTTIANIKKMNPKLKFMGMLPSKVDGRNPRHKAHLDQLTKAFPELILPLTIGLRSSVADALASGVPVWKIKKTAAIPARKEMRAVAKEVLTRLEEKS